MNPSLISPSAHPLHNTFSFSLSLSPLQSSLNYPFSILCFRRKMRTGGTLNTTSTTPSAVIVQHSPWHSPVPYLFGGLAAMLGLIAFALLILACSYWKLSGYLESNEGGERDPENGDEKAGEPIKVPSTFEEKIVVIMAGDEKPTFLATPISSRASFGDNNKNNNNTEENEKTEKPEMTKQQGSTQESQEQQRVVRENQS